MKIEDLYIKIFVSTFKEVYSNVLLKDLIDYNFTDNRGVRHDCYDDFGYRYKLSFDKGNSRKRVDIIKISFDFVVLKENNRLICISWKDTKELKDKLTNIAI